MLGDSFTESMGPWKTSFVGRLADEVSAVRNSERRRGRILSFELSQYRAHRAAKSGLDVDEAIVFIDISDVQDEAGLVHDVDDSGAVALARHQYHYSSLVLQPASVRQQISGADQLPVGGCRARPGGLGYYYLDHGFNGNVFDLERSGWTYRKVVEDQPFELGFAPLGVEGRHRQREAQDGPASTRTLRSATFPSAWWFIPGRRSSSTTRLIRAKCRSGATGARASASASLPSFRSSSP